MPARGLPLQDDLAGAWRFSGKTDTRSLILERLWQIPVEIGGEEGTKNEPTSVLYGTCNVPGR